MIILVLFFSSHLLQFNFMKMDSTFKSKSEYSRKQNNRISKGDMTFIQKKNSLFISWHYPEKSNKWKILVTSS